MSFSRSSIERLLRALGRESHRGIWAIPDPEDTTAILIGHEETGVLRIKNLTLWEGKYEELEQRVLSTVGAWIAGHRVGFGPNVEMISSEGAFPLWGFSEREKAYLEFCRYLRSRGKLRS